jgi:hypothetical protein
MFLETFYIGVVFTCCVKFITVIIQTVIDAHGLKIQRQRKFKFLPKFPGWGPTHGGSRLSGKVTTGARGSHYFEFYCIFIDKYFELCLRGAMYVNLVIYSNKSKSSRSPKYVI